MPLIKSGSKAAIGENISEMEASGHPRNQAIAAALDTARRYGRAIGGPPGVMQERVPAGAVPVAGMAGVPSSPFYPANASGVAPTPGTGAAPSPSAAMPTSPPSASTGLQTGLPAPQPGASVGTTGLIPGPLGLPGQTQLPGQNQPQISGMPTGKPPGMAAHGGRIGHDDPHEQQARGIAEAIMAIAERYFRGKDGTKERPKREGGGKTTSRISGEPSQPDWHGTMTEETGKRIGEEGQRWQLLLKDMGHKLFDVSKGAQAAETPEPQGHYGEGGSASIADSAHDRHDREAHADGNAVGNDSPVADPTSDISNQGSTLGFLNAAAKKFGPPIPGYNYPSFSEGVEESRRGLEANAARRANMSELDKVGDTAGNFTNEAGAFLASRYPGLKLVAPLMQAQHFGTEALPDDLRTGQATVSIDDRLKQLYQERAIAEKRRGEAEAEYKMEQRTGKGPNYNAAQQKFTDRSNELSGLNALIQNLELQNSPEGKLKAEQDRIKAERENRNTEMNTSVKEKYQDQMPWVPIATGAGAFGSGLGIGTSHVNAYNNQVTDLLDAWKKALDTNDQPLAQALKAQFEKMTGANASPWQKMIGKGGGPGGGLKSAITGGILGELGQLGPIIVDYARSIPGSDLYNKTVHTMQTPSEVIGRLLSGILWGSGPAEVGHQLAGIRKIKPRGYGPETDTMGSRIPGGPNGPPISLSAEPSPPRLGGSREPGPGGNQPPNPGGGAGPTRGRLLENLSAGEKAAPPDQAKPQPGPPEAGPPSNPPAAPEPSPPPKVLEVHPDSIRHPSGSGKGGQFAGADDINDPNVKFVPGKRRGKSTAKTSESSKGNEPGTVGDEGKIIGYDPEGRPVYEKPSLPIKSDLGGEGHARGGLAGIPSHAMALAGQYARGGRVIVGPVMGNTGGRADKLPVSVPKNAFVIPADVVSHLGEGNTGAGMQKLEKQFGGSYRKTGEGVPILISDGEYVVSPEAVLKHGQGDIDRGHKWFENFVLHNRHQHIQTLANLPGPAR